MGKLRDLVKKCEDDFIEIDAIPYWIHFGHNRLLYKVVKIFANLDKEKNIDAVNTFLSQNMDCSVIHSYEDSKIIVIVKTEDRGTRYGKLLFSEKESRQK